MKTLLGTLSKRRIRYHQGAAEEDFQRLRALEGICGECENVRVNIINVDGKRKAMVDCEAGRSPVDLYYSTPLGEKAECSDFTPLE